MSKTTLIKATGIHRYYDNTHAVNDLTFELKTGDILGFLGPNGAGKSTSMQILSGSLTPDEGQIEINGIDLIEKPTAAKQQLGYLPEQPPLYKELTVDEYLIYCAKLRGIKNPEIVASLDRAKQRCGLTECGHRLISNLSKGYQQRVGIAQAIIHSPAVIILDEPTVGLDPIQIQEIRLLITELGKEHGVILSTHILPEVQAVCNRVQIIQQGKLVYHSDMQTLQTDMQSAQIELELAENINDSLFNDINGIENIEHISARKSCLSFVSDQTLIQQAVQQITKRIVEQQLTLVSLTPKQRTLEQIFIDLTTRENATKSAEDAA